MKKWNDKSTFEKTSDIISAIAFCAWLIFEFINKNGTVKWADILSRIAIIIICIFEGICNRKEHKIISYIAIGGFVCILATFVLEFMIFAK